MGAASGIDRDRFDELSDKIVELFDTEAKATWYETGKKTGELVVRRRLRYKFYSVRRGLISSGLVQRKTKEKRVVNQQQADFAKFDR
ncbi:Catalase-peroxidase, partial [Frankliniella fusca]